MEIESLNLHFLHSASLAEIERLDESAETFRISYGEGDVVWRAWGQGRPLILIHGGGGCWLHWIRNIAFLARSYRVLVPDLPGFGDSGMPRGMDAELEPGEIDDLVPDGWSGEKPLPIDVIARLIADGIEQLAGRQPVFIVGFSFGSVIGSHVCARLGPGAIELMVLVGATALINPTFGRNTRLQSWRDIADRDAMRAVQRANLLTLMLADERNADDLAIDIQILGTGRVRMRRARRQSYVIEMLKRFGVRIAGIWGSRDITLAAPVEQIEALLRGIDPRAEFHVVEGAGHWVAFEREHEFNALLSGVLERAAVQHAGAER